MSVRAAQCTMPRNRGTGSTRKRKPAAPKKQETSETMQTPEQQGEDEGSTTSEQDLPPESVYFEDAKTREVVTEFDGKLLAANKAIDDVDVAEYNFRKADYEHKQKNLAATTRARGSSAATKEEAMQAEIDYLKARLKHTEELLEASEMMAEASEARYAVLENVNSKLQNMVDMMRRIAELKKSVDSGTHKSGPVSS